MLTIATYNLANFLCWAISYSHEVHLSFLVENKPTEQAEQKFINISQDSAYQMNSPWILVLVLTKSTLHEFWKLESQQIWRISNGQSWFQNFGVRLFKWKCSCERSRSFSQRTHIIECSFKNVNHRWTVVLISFCLHLYLLKLDKEYICSELRQIAAFDKI